MDDFFAFGDSFDDCLNNLEKVLSRYEEKKLVLNWKKCHFMVTNDIVLQEFDITIKDKKVTKNVVADHLSRLTRDSRSDIIPIDDYFPDESLFSVSTMSLFVNIVNFLISRPLTAHWNTQDRRKFLNEVKINTYYIPYCMKGSLVLPSRPPFGPSMCF
jgi:hypothetical protein